MLVNCVALPVPCRRLQLRAFARHRLIAHNFAHNVKNRFGQEQSLRTCGREPTSRQEEARRCSKMTAALTDNSLAWHQSRPCGLPTSIAFTARARTAAHKSRQIQLANQRREAVLGEPHFRLTMYPMMSWVSNSLSIRFGMLRCGVLSKTANSWPSSKDHRLSPGMRALAINYRQPGLSRRGDIRHIPCGQVRGLERCLPAAAGRAPTMQSPKQ